MIAIMGNSEEKVKINDLNDVIYFHQKKLFTDQEVDTSRDLQRELRLGNLIRIGWSPNHKNSGEVDSEDEKPVTASPVHRKEIADAVSSAVSDTIRNLGGTISDVIRQEISKLTVMGQMGPVPPFSGPSLAEPVYTPDIKIGDMTSSVKIEEKKSESDSVSLGLIALKNLKK